MTNSGTPHDSAGDPLRWLGVGLMLAALAARALATGAELPGWDLDPTLVVAPISGIGPAWSFWLDVAAVLGAGLALLGEARAGRGVRPVPLALAAIGCAVVVWHGWLSPAGTFGDRRVGSAWGAAVLSGVACWHICRDERNRRVVAAVGLGLIAVLALKGAQDVLIAHPRTVEQFERERELLFAAQGWSPDSPMARSYERRLMQPEASGWFGLANVYASFAAASAVGMLVLAGGAALRLRGKAEEGGRVSPAVAAAVALGLVAAIAALLLSDSKGGFIAAGAGVMAAGALVLVVRRARGGAAPAWGAPAAAMVAALAVAGPLLLVVVRGLAGEELGDRSLLFRWFYLQAAARITAEHPLLGVGPDSFQGAYLAAKNPLSPEDVRSPHSLLADWGATLGMIGLVAWGLLWLGWVWGASRRPLSDALGGITPKGEPHAPPLRPELRAAGLVIAAATLLATFIDRSHATPDVAVVRFVGLLAWCAVAWGIVVAGRSALALSLALAGSALTLAAHAQIDVTPTLPASAGLMMVLIATAAAPAKAENSTEPHPTGRRWLVLAPGAAVVGLGLALGVTTAVPASRWGGMLAEAARLANPVAEAGHLLRAVQSAPDPQARRSAQQALLTHLSSHLGRRVEASGPAVDRALLELEVRHLTAAAEVLEAASALEPAEWRTRREASRLLLRAASAVRGAGDAAAAGRLMDHAVALARAGRPGAGAAPPPGATEQAWLGLVYRTCHGLAPRPEHLRAAAGAYELAAGLDPYNASIAADLFEIHQELGEAQTSAEWGRRALRIDDLARLDVAGRAMPAERRAAIERALSGP